MDTGGENILLVFTTFAKSLVSQVGLKFELKRGIITPFFA